jgi:hypothetical protein
VLVLAGNAVSRATAFAAMDDKFQLDPNTRRNVEDVGFLLFVSGTLAAILLVAAVSVAALRYAVLPRWLGWAGLPTAALLVLAIAFVGFLVFAAWVLTVSAALALRRSPEAAARTGATPSTSESGPSRLGHGYCLRRRCRPPPARRGKAERTRS